MKRARFRKDNYRKRGQHWLLRDILRLRDNRYNAKIVYYGTVEIIDDFGKTKTYNNVSLTFEFIYSSKDLVCVRGKYMSINLYPRFIYLYNSYRFSEEETKEILDVLNRCVFSFKAVTIMDTIYPDVLYRVRRIEDMKKRGEVLWSFNRYLLKKPIDTEQKTV